MPAKKKSPRLGLGYDIHRLRRGRPLILGGVAIPFSHGLEGHSDADVICHAVADSLLGAANLGDLGSHFPNDDPAYKNISSLKLLDKVGKLLRRQKASIQNIDVMLIAERPKISGHTDRMKANIARALGIAADRVSIKATTNEKLGCLGRGQGLAALAVSLIEKEAK